MSGRASVRQELAALRRVFWSQPYNSVAKTVGTITLVVVWAIISLLTAIGEAEPPAHFMYYTALVFLVLGRWWGIELAWQMAGPQIEVSHRPTAAERDAAQDDDDAED